MNSMTKKLPGWAMLVVMVMALVALPFAANAGGIYGSGSECNVITGGDDHTYWVSMTGQEFAEISVSGDGDSDLDLYIYDERGNLIGSDTDSTDQCYVSWVPRWSGVFKIVVHNYGRRANAYCVETN